MRTTLAEPGTAADAASVAQDARTGAIPRGNGRSYGDSSLAQPLVIGTRRLDRFLAFDEAEGRLTCEGGTLLSDIIEALVPRGWFPPVTPGTKFVTVGGMIASDVHGKNHHGAGSFADHVERLDLAMGDGTVLTCSPDQHPDLFAATCGGMGLTGIILRATFRLLPVASARIAQRTIRAENLDMLMRCFEAHADSTYSVAWVDCLASGADLGRSVVILGEHASLDQLPATDRAAPFLRVRRREKRLPLDLPGFTLNRLSVRIFNRLYYRLQQPGDALVDLDPYFYPLDALHDWNRMYGRRGFVQYQCVLPLARSRAGTQELLTEIARIGDASFLAVLKRLGPGSFGHLSFPMEGYTLALDFPVGERTFRLLDRLDEITAAHGGRIYLAKDARTSPRMVEAGYPRLGEFRDTRRRYGLDRRFRSLQSERLGI